MCSTPNWLGHTRRLLSDNTLVLSLQRDPTVLTTPTPHQGGTTHLTVSSETLCQLDLSTYNNTVDNSVMG